MSRAASNERKKGREQEARFRILPGKAGTRLDWFERRRTVHKAAAFIRL